MANVLTNPEEIKKFLKHLVYEQVEAYFERFDSDSEMLLAIADSQSQADRIKSFLLRSSVLSDRCSMAIAVQRFPNLFENDDKFPLFGVFYVSEHPKEDRAKLMNNVLVKAINRILAGNNV